MLFTASDGWGYFFFDLFSHSGLRAFFTNDFANCTTVYAQPSGAVHSIWWLGFFFFLTCSPILDLGHFSQVILPIVLQIMPQPKNNPNYQVLFTASDGWGFLFTCSPILDLGHFSQMILPIVLQFMPNHQVLFTASDGWGYFFLTCSPVLDLGHFAQMILPIVLQIMPPPKNNPNHQVLFTASDGWGFFWPVLPFWT